jgi:hypothetical protein
LSSFIPSVPSLQNILPIPRVAAFHCDPDDVERDNLLPIWQKHKVAVKTAIWHSPAYSKVDSAAACYDHWHERVSPRLFWLKEKGLDLIACGDEFGREEIQRDAYERNPWTAQATSEIASTIARMGNCLYLDVIDESNTKIAGWQPHKLVKAWRDGGGPTIAWPVLGSDESIENPDFAGLHMKQWRHWDCRSLRERIRCIHESFTGVRQEWLVSSLIAATAKQWSLRQGRWYAGHPGVSPGEITAQGWAAIACGASYLEVYSYDPWRWITQRCSGIDGEKYTGFRPGTDLWPDFLELLESIDRQRHILTATPIYKPVLRTNWIFGRRGPYVIGVYFGEREVKVPIGRGVIRPGNVWFHYLKD